MSSNAAGPVIAYLGLGSNLGDRIVNLTSALTALGRMDGITVEACSRIYESEPVGPSQPDYLNGVARVSVTLSPHELLAACQAVENSLGRVRDVRWGPRTIDVDILLYGDAEISEPDLVVPHPLMLERSFVLLPLLELVADLRLPDGTALSDVPLAAGALEGARPFAPPIPVG